MRYVSIPIVALLAASSSTVSSAVRLDEDEEGLGQNSSATETILALDQQMQSTMAKLGQEIEHSANGTSAEHGQGGQAGGAAQQKPKAAKKDKGKKPELVPPSNPAVLQLWKYLKEGGLGKYDHDDSNGLNIGEFRELCHDINPINPVAVSDSEVEEVLANFDSDSSGCINQEEALEFVRQDPTGSRPEAPTDDCTGWSPSAGQDKGKGGSCEKWGWQNFWCYVPKGFEGPGKQASLLHPGKFFASCGIGKSECHTEEELKDTKARLAAREAEADQDLKEVAAFKKAAQRETETAKAESVEALKKVAVATSEAAHANQEKLAIAKEAAAVSETAMKAQSDMKHDLQKVEADSEAKVQEAINKQTKAEEQVQQLQLQVQQQQQKPQQKQQQQAPEEPFYEEWADGCRSSDGSEVQGYNCKGTNVDCLAMANAAGPQAFGYMHKPSDGQCRVLGLKTDLATVKNAKFTELCKAGGAFMKGTDISRPTDASPGVCKKWCCYKK